MTVLSKRICSREEAEKAFDAGTVVAIETPDGRTLEFAYPETGFTLEQYVDFIQKNSAAEFSDLQDLRFVIHDYEAPVAAEPERSLSLNDIVDRIVNSPSRRGRKPTPEGERAGMILLAVAAATLVLSYILKG